MNRGLVWAVAGLAAVVCGCGGGSGSDGGGGTGLVPDAPAIGAVLYADATTLRELHMLPQRRYWSLPDVIDAIAT